MVMLYLYSVANSITPAHQDKKGGDLSLGSFSMFCINLAKANGQ